MQFNVDSSRWDALAVRLGQALIAIALGAAAWGYFSPRPYTPLIIANVFLPLLAVPLVVWSKGKVAVWKKGCPAQIALAWIFCGLTLFMRALDYPILGWRTVLGSAFVLSLGFSIWVWRSRTSSDRPRNAALVLLVVAFVFALGAIVTLDRVLDWSKPSNETVHIAEKAVSGSRSQGHVVSVYTQEAPGQAVDFDVSPRAYSQFSVGDTVQIQRHEGAFGIPWFQFVAWLGRPNDETRINVR